jgi:hypothetical protein
MKKKTEDEQFQTEFKEDPDCYVIFATNGLIMGRMIAKHKDCYSREHQGELVIFNANVLTKTHGKIWYGDINVTEDFDNLKNIADQLEEDLYILMEGDARYGYEKQNIKELISKAKAVIKCNKTKKKSVIEKTPIIDKPIKKRKTNGTSNRSTK